MRTKDDAKVSGFEIIEDDSDVDKIAVEEAADEDLSFDGAADGDDTDEADAELEEEIPEDEAEKEKDENEE